MDCAGNKCGSISDGLEVLKRTDAMRGAGPNRVKNGMQELAALGGGESVLGGLPALSGKARGGEGLEGALRLKGENAGAAFDFAGRKGDLRGVFKGDGEWIWRSECDEFHGQWLRRAGKVRDQAGVT